MKHFKFRQRFMKKIKTNEKTVDNFFKKCYTVKNEILLH